MNIRMIYKKRKDFILAFSILMAFLNSYQSSAQVKLDSMLTACYPFSGNANDYSGNNHHGTVYGATLTQDRFGNANSAYHFNGTDNYIEIQNFDSLVPNDEVSISFWCIVYNAASHAQFQLQPDNTSDRFGINVHYDHSGVPSTFWDYGNISFGGRMDTINIPFVSQWEHYVFVSSALQNLMMEYRDGVLLKSENHNSSITNKLRSLWIGKGSTLNCVNGDIDDIQFYNRVITPAEVQALYTNNPSYVNPCNNASAVNELNELHGINIYPNPSNGKFIISLNEPMGKASVKIFDPLGRKIYNGQFSNALMNKEEIELSAAGIYFVQIIDAQKQYVQKIVVQ